MISNRILRPQEAVEYLAERHGIRTTVGTLAQHRSRGGGPEFVKGGRAVGYYATQLDAYAARFLVVRSSTSDPGRPVGQVAA